MQIESVLVVLLLAFVIEGILAVWAVWMGVKADMLMRFIVYKKLAQDYFDWKKSLR